MRRVARAALTLFALASLVLAGAGGLRAAEPTSAPTVGGTLSVDGRTISVYSNGNVPATIFMSAEAVTLTETSFALLPGETRELTFSGEPDGRVTALYVAQAEGQESGSAALSISLSPVPYVPPTDWAPLLLLAAVLGAFLLVLRRFRPWRWRIVTA